MESRDLSSKYGQEHRGIVALEPIQAGEAIFTCDLSICNYYRLEDPTNKMTKSDVTALMKANPESADYLRYYTYMLDDDLFDVPQEELVVAMRDIAEGEELTYHYGLMDSENSFWVGLICRCGAKICNGELKFDWWRDPNWQEKYEKYAGAHIKRKIKKLREEQEKNKVSS
ncbi:unnamed protein product [Rotaria magnacalcarata]|uniref:SET domain-containing protein n=1 Tax=Rotaria magnacalcarata TaxID=392030 RepID=A0A816MQY1_9BILA|nr:unnamed protein product [Rotaria magnacalcarata]CAF3850370.1 unnamed protein product [Rotaria magnacalcarata]